MSAVKIFTNISNIKQKSRTVNLVSGIENEIIHN
jgi:hypothetical protein